MSGSNRTTVTALSRPGAGRPSLSVRVTSAIKVAIPCLFLAQMGRLPAFSTGDRQAPILLGDIAVAAVLAVGALSALRTRSLLFDRVAMLAMLFAALGAVAAGAGASRYHLTSFELAVSLAYLARWVFYTMIYVIVINSVTAKDVNHIWTVIERSVVAFATFGIFQAIFLPDFAQRIYSEEGSLHDWDRQGHRLVSTALDPNIAGALMLIVLLVQIARVSEGAPQSRRMLLALSVALVATLSRSSIIAVLAGIAIVLVSRGISLRLARLFAGVALLLALSLPKLLTYAASFNKLSVDGSALTRLAQWYRAWQLFRDNPVIGIGFNTYGFVQERYGYSRLGTGTYSLDGGLLFVAVLTGIVGVSLYVALIGVTVRRCRRLWRTIGVPAEWRALAVGIASGTVALCIQSLFTNTLLSPFVMEILWILWGLVFVMSVGIARKTEPPAGKRGLIAATGWTALS